MRWLLLALLSLFAPTSAQFWDFGSNNNEDDSYADQFGFKESINQWSDVLKKMAHKNIFGAPTPPPSEFQRVAPPPDVDKIDPKAIQSQKHDIINAKLLDLILPRFKGEAPLLLRPSTTATEPPKKEIVTKPNVHKPTKKSPTTTAVPEDEDEEDEEDIDDEEEETSTDDDDDDEDDEESEEKPETTTKKAKLATKAAEATTVTTTTPSTTTTASTSSTSTTTTESPTTTTESATPTKTTIVPSTTTTVTFETTKKIVEIIEQTLSTVGKVEEPTKMTSASTTASTTVKSTTPKATISSKPTTKKLNIVFHTAAKEKFDNSQKKVVKRNDSPKNSTNPVFDSQLEAKVRKMMKEIFEKEFKKKIDNSSLALRHELQKHKDELLKAATEHLSILNGNSIIADLANKWTDKMGSTTKEPVKEKKIEEEITTEKAATKAVTVSTVKTTIKPKSTTAKTTTTAETTEKVKVAEPSPTPTPTTTTKKQEPTTTTESTTVTTTAKPKPTTVKTTKKTTPKPKTDEELTVVQAEDEPDTELDEKDKQKLEKEVEKEKEKVVKLAESKEVEPTTMKAKKTKKLKRHKKRKVTTTTPEPEEEEDDDDDDDELDEADIDEIEKELEAEKSKMKIIRAKDDEVKADEKRKKQTPADRSGMKVIKAIDLMSGETKDDIIKPKRKEAESESEEENDEQEVEGSAAEDLPIEKTITAENDGDENMDETPLTGENEEEGSGIPEAEEEEVSAEVKEDKNDEKPHDVVTEAVAEDNPTTTTTAKPVNQTGQNIFNLQANANSDANPNVANVIAPVAGIIDGIAPILFPFLQSRGFSARAAAQGAPLFQPDRNENNRDLLENSDSETSLVGLSSQLAREILQPGSLRKEREEMETLLRKKAEEAKAKLAERERERLDFEAKQEAMKRQLLEQERRMRFSMQNNPLVQQAFAAPSMNMEKVFEEAAAETFKQETDPPQSPSVYSITSPPGIQRFRTPPPPPPGYRPKGYDGPLPPFPAFTVQNENKGVEEVIGGTTKETPFQQFPTPNPSRGNARSLSKEKLNFLQQMKANRQRLLTRNSGTPPPGADFSNSFGFSGGDANSAKKNPMKPEKKTPFAPVPPMPSGTISFGGGKRPTVSFDEVEKQTDKGGADFFGR